METWSLVLTALGVVVAVVAFLWQYVVTGRKRLGYRVQMDATATDLVESQYADVFTRLERKNGKPLVDPSFVLLRVENDGIATIEGKDYHAAPGAAGIEVEFPGRRVVGVVVTELSSDTLRSYLRPPENGVPRDPAGAEQQGVEVQEIREDGHVVGGQIQLPKVELNRDDHYKVLVALDAVAARNPDRAGRAEPMFPPPKVTGGLKGGGTAGRIKGTVARTGWSRPTVGLIAFLTLLLAFQLTRPLIFGDDRAPLDCASGSLTIVGSTAFAPVLQEASRSYSGTCPDAGFTFATQGSEDGQRTLNQAGQRSADPAMLAFSDGAKAAGQPNLLPRPVAFSLFTIVINPDAGVQDLTTGQIRQLAAGQLANWRDIGGNDLPVRLVDRYSDSGTRHTFQEQLLAGVREPGDNSDDCANPDPGAPPGVVRCQRASTEDVLDAVARTPGAVGYSELGAATGHPGVLPVRINGQQATLDGAVHAAYPFWETEYAYTYGEPKADSLAASFLRYLTNQVGEDVIRSYGHRPCAELANPVLCRPGPAEP